MPDELSLIPKEYKETGISIETIFSKVGILISLLIILGILAYGGLFFYGKSLEHQLDDLKVQAEDINKQRDEEFEARVKSIDAALKGLKIILKNHLYWSNLFSKLENLTVGQVGFFDFKSTIKPDNSIGITLDGKTAAYTYLAKQMVSFSQDKLVAGIKASKITLGTEGGIEFSLEVNFLKDILLK